MSEQLAWVVYTDGASRGNPGLAGVGVFAISPEGQKHEFNEFLGEATNNQAEYQAMILALKKMQELEVKELTLRADSELMVKQMLGIYRVKNERIQPLYKEAKSLVEGFQSVSFAHVRRELNKEADRLANEAIDYR